MNSFVIFHIYLVVIYLIYRYLFSGSTHFTVNRIFLLSAVPVAGLLAFMPRFVHPGQMFGEVILPAFVVHSAQTAAALPDIIPETAEYFNLLKVIYFSIAAILFIRLIRGHLHLLSFFRKAKKEKINGIYLIRSSAAQAPYSYFRYLVLPGETESDEAERMMIAHEKVHIIQRHSWDLLYLNMLVVFLWINPVSWLIIREMKRVHEYLADKNTIAGMPDKRVYYQLLLSQYLNISQYGFVNTFSYLPLKKRMIMMKKKEDLKRSLWRYGMLLPLAAILLSFSYAGSGVKGSLIPVYQGQREHQKVSAPQNEKVYAEVDTVPEYEGGINALMNFLAQHIRYPRIARINGTEGTVYVSFIVEKDGSVSDVEVKRGIGDGCDEESVRVVKLMKKWKPGKKDGKNVRCHFILPIRYQLEDDDSSKKKK